MQFCASSSQQFGRDVLFTGSFKSDKTTGHLGLLSHLTIWAVYPFKRRPLCMVQSKSSECDVNVWLFISLGWLQLSAVKNYIWPSYFLDAKASAIIFRATFPVGGRVQEGVLAGLVGEEKVCHISAHSSNESHMSGKLIKREKAMPAGSMNAACVNAKTVSNTPILNSFELT